MAPVSLVVTGANGFVGRFLVDRARARGHAVMPLSRQDGTLPGGYENVPMLAKRFEGAGAVVHLAARAHLGGSDADFECNVRSARAVAQAARLAAVPRLVVLSSIGVNGNTTRGKPFDETDAPAPEQPYARSKLRSEQEVLRVLADSATAPVILRPPLVYGPGAPGNFGKLVRLVARGLPLPLGAVRNHRSLVGVDPLADAILLCADHPAAAGELFLLADGTDLSTPEIVAAIGRGLKRTPRLFDVPPGWLLAAAGAVGRRRAAQALCDSLQVDAGKARRLLGWRSSMETAECIAAAVAQVARP